MKEDMEFEDISVGIDHIDHEHVHLIRLLLDMLEALKGNAPTDTLLEKCSVLIKETRYHHDVEERLMLKVFFPDTEAHIGQHMKCLEYYNQLVKQIKSDDRANAAASVNYLLEWKRYHIQEADKKIADFLMTKPA